MPNVLPDLRFDAHLLFHLPGARLSGLRVGNPVEGIVMNPTFRRLTAAGSVGIALVLAAPAYALDHATDPDFVYEMVDIGFCALERHCCRTHA